VAEGLEYVATWNAGMLSSDDLVEAMTAFMERRPPRFSGR
jgi:enoyl-CoA hydratase